MQWYLLSLAVSHIRVSSCKQYRWSLMIRGNHSRGKWLAKECPLIDCFIYEIDGEGVLLAVD